MSPWRTARATLWTDLLFMGIVSWNFQIFWYFWIPMQYQSLSYCYWSTLAISSWHKLICLYKTLCVLFQGQYICYITFSGWCTDLYRNMLTHPIRSDSLFCVQVSDTLWVLKVMHFIDICVILRTPKLNPPLTHVQNSPSIYYRSLFH